MPKGTKVWKTTKLIGLWGDLVVKDTTKKNPRPWFGRMGDAWGRSQDRKSTKPVYPLHVSHVSDIAFLLIGTSHMANSRKVVKNN